jgi:hypothetical protein
VEATFWQPPQGPAAAAAQILDLAVTRTLRYETGARVIDLVTKHQSGGKALSPYGPAGVSSLDVVPLDVLHALGVATTPQIPSAVHLSQWWAVLRYLWALRPSAQGQGLALDTGTSIIRHHQRTVLSEQLAIGLAGWYIEMVARVPSVHSVDAEFAVYDPAWGTLLTWGGGLLPDYLYFSSASPTATPTHLHLVECKGTREPLPHYATAATHNTQYRTLIQLAHAAKQLEGITIGGLNVVRVAFAATLEEDEICLYAVDPPDDDERDAKSSEDPAGRKTIEVDRLARVVDAERFSEDVRALRDSKLLAYCGAYADALAVLPSDYRELVSFREHPGAARRLPDPDPGGIGYRGSRLRVELYDGFAVEIELGLQEDVFEACRTGDGERLESALQALRETFETPTRSIALADEHTVRSESSGGTMLQVRVSADDN